MRIAGHRGGEAADEDAVQTVAQGGSSVHIGTHVVADNHVPARVGSADTYSQGVSGNDVSFSSRGSTDGVVRRIDDDDAIVGVAVIEQAGDVRSYEISDDRVGVGLNDDAAVAEALDDQTPDGAPGTTGPERQARHRTGAAAVEHDKRRSSVARLGPAIDRDGAGEGWQRRRQVDRVRTGAAEIERDRVGARIGIGVDDRLAQRTCTRIVGVGDGVQRQGAVPSLLGCVGDHDAGFDRAGVQFEGPVAAQSRAAGPVGACGDVGTRQRGERVDQRASLGCGGNVAAVDQQVGIGRQCLAPAFDQQRAARERFGIERAVAQTDRAVRAFGQDVDRGEVMASD